MSENIEILGNPQNEKLIVRDSQNRTKYIDISRPNLLNKNEIEEVQEKQKKLKKQKEEILLKVKMACMVKTGQIKMEEYEKTLKRTLIS